MAAFGATALYESLTLTDPSAAGGPDRRNCRTNGAEAVGLHLLRAGLTAHLILSVGRFEVSKMRCLRLSCFEELLQLRDDDTPPDEQHFFVAVDSSSARAHKVR